MNLPPHLQGVKCREPKLSAKLIVIRPDNPIATDLTGIEQLWNTLSEREKHDLMMIALIEPDGDDTTIVAQIGDFRLWGDGEIYYYPEEKCDE